MFNKKNKQKEKDAALMVEVEQNYEFESGLESDWGFLNLMKTRKLAGSL